MKKINYLGEICRVPLDLKSTINLPRTDFPMKANLPQNEPKLLARWEEIKVYDRIREARQKAPTYVLHDGPPYANGPIHLGTAFNKCLKDFIVKSKTMAGFDSPYVPGWDCHGLPIEIKVDQQLGGKKLRMKPVEVRLECRKYAEKYLDLQRSQFKRIGVFGRFDNPYSTMTPQYESVVLQEFYAFLEKGFVYKGLRSVYWCIRDQTALAEAEVEYENHTSPTVWVKYPLRGDPAILDPALKGKKVFTVIWTTTPWTLPASMAVAFHPEEEYVALETESENAVYIVAEKLASDFANKTGLDAPRTVARFPGSKLEFTEFSHPFLDRMILGVVAEYVTMDQGTGVVHTAPSHGADDFATGVKYKLDLKTNVDEAGFMHHGLPEYEGKQVFEANAPIVELLKRRGVLMHAETLEHSYPQCWRCHNPIIFRSTEQWFISMETPMEGGGTLRGQTLEEIKQVKWDPAWGEERISNMIATRPDWCISRQRIWGVPIAVFLCVGCGEPLNDPAINRKVVKLFAGNGADSWYTPAADALVEAARCSKCNASQFTKETDILDVWFESGSSHVAVLGREPNLPWPADLYLEGGDQFRGWFHSSLLCAMGAQGSAPYRMVVSPGWTLDEQGQAMSKSRGNDVDPVDIANRLGGEIVRLWVASVDFRQDVVGSERLMQRMAENYRKIRNTFRYILGNLSDFDPRRDSVPFGEMESIDRFMLLRTVEFSLAVQEYSREFVFHKIYQQLNQFCIVDLSAFYFDVLKDRLYISAPKSRLRRSAQTAIWRIGEALARLVAPIMSFTSEEVWRYLPSTVDRPVSVHLAQFPTARDITGETSWSAAVEAVTGNYGVEGMEEFLAAPGDVAAQLLPLHNLRKDWNGLLRVREDVLKALESARNAKTIGGSLEAQVKLSATEPVYSLLARYKDQLRYLFIVSDVMLERQESGNGAEGGTIHVNINKAPGKKCERCWNYSIHIGEDAAYPSVCERCSAVLREIEASGLGTESKE
jgi:isoleucyl-tRNA synthetase